MNNQRQKECAKLGWKLEGSKYIFKSQWYDVRQDDISLPNEHKFTYTYIEHPGAVFVVPITANKDIILIRTYRYTLDKWCWEIPAGTMGDQVGATPEFVAKQELREEIGAQCNLLHNLGSYYLSNGIGNIKGHFFLAQDTKLVGQADLEETEVISEVATVSIKRVKEMIREGEILDGDSAFAILLALSKISEV